MLREWPVQLLPNDMKATRENVHPPVTALSAHSPFHPYLDILSEKNNRPPNILIKGFLGADSEY